MVPDLGVPQLPCEIIGNGTENQESTYKTNEAIQKQLEHHGKFKKSLNTNRNVWTPLVANQCKAIQINEHH